MLHFYNNWDFKYTLSYSNLWCNWKSYTRYLKFKYKSKVHCVFIFNENFKWIPFTKALKSNKIKCKSHLKWNENTIRNKVLWKFMLQVHIAVKVKNSQKQILCVTVALQYRYITHFINLNRMASFTISELVLNIVLIFPGSDRWKTDFTSHKLLH